MDLYVSYFKHLFVHLKKLEAQTHFGDISQTFAPQTCRLAARTWTSESALVIFRGVSLQTLIPLGQTLSSAAGRKQDWRDVTCPSALTASNHQRRRSEKIRLVIRHQLGPDVSQQQSLSLLTAAWKHTAHNVCDIRSISVNFEVKQRQATVFRLESDEKNTKLSACGHFFCR